MGVAEMMCTTVTTKSEFFPKFVAKLRTPKPLQFLPSREYILQDIYKRLLDLRVNVSEEHFLEICALCSELWVLDGWDKQEEHKTDTWVKGASTTDGKKV